MTMHLGLTKVIDIKAGDQMGHEGKVEKVRETKTLRILTIYNGLNGKVLRFKIGQSIYLV